jgi:hypothetical protein
MFELAKAMGDNDEAALVMRMMKNYNRAHPPKASSSVSTASSFVPAEVQTLYSAAPAAATEGSPAAATAGEAGSCSTAYQTEEKLMLSKNRDQDILNTST